MNCNECEYYNMDENYCTAVVCDGIDCPTLPCEEDEYAD